MKLIKIPARSRSVVFALFANFILFLDPPSTPATFLTCEAFLCFVSVPFNIGLGGNDGNLLDLPCCAIFLREQHGKVPREGRGEATTETCGKETVRLRCISFREVHPQTWKMLLLSLFGSLAPFSGSNIQLLQQPTNILKYTVAHFLLQDSINTAYLLAATQL